MVWTTLQMVLLGLLLAAFLSTGDTPPVMGTTGRMLGLAGIAFGLGLAVRAFRDLGRSFRVAPEPKPGATLVRNGIYGLFRHPMYTAAVATSVGMLWVRPAPMVLLATAVLVAYYLFKARYEEARLRMRYPEYAAYMKDTYGVIPWKRG